MCECSWYEIRESGAGVAGGEELLGEGVGEGGISAEGGGVGLWSVGNSRAVEDTANQEEIIFPGA